MMTCTDGQANLSLSWEYMSDGSFSHVAVHLFLINSTARNVHNS